MKNDPEKMFYLAGLMDTMEKLSEGENHVFSEHFESRSRDMVASVKKRRERFRKGLSLAAAIGLFLLTGVGIFLGDMLLSARTEPDPPAKWGVEGFYIENNNEPTSEGDLGRGYMSVTRKGTAAYEASKAWAAFIFPYMETSEYKESLHAANIYGVPDAFRMYSDLYRVYDEKAGNTLEDIAQKYGLKILGKPTVVENYAKLLEIIKTEAFLLDPETVVIDYARAFAEGNFNASFKYDFSGEKWYEVSAVGNMTVARKDCLPDLYSFPELSAWYDDEVGYVTKTGDWVDICYSESGGCILYEGEEACVEITISLGTEEALRIYDKKDTLRYIKQLADLVEFNSF